MAINKVGSKGIVDCSVAAADFAPGTVTSVKIADDAVTNAKLSNSSLTASGTSITLGASGTLSNKFVDWQSVTTADGSTFNTAVSGQGYFIDTTSAAHTITLPASPVVEDTIQIIDVSGNAGSANITVARNGEEIQNAADNLVIDINNASPILVYTGATYGWVLAGS